MGRNGDGGKEVGTLFLKTSRVRFAERSGGVRVLLLLLMLVPS
jgi:hypothetical protein